MPFYFAKINPGIKMAQLFSDIGAYGSITIESSPDGALLIVRDPSDNVVSNKIISTETLAELLLSTRNSTGKEVICEEFASATGTVSAQKNGDLHALFIIATDTFTLDVKLSVDGVNYANYLTGVTAAGLHLIDNVPNAFAQLNVTANAGLITAYMV